MAWTLEAETSFKIDSGDTTPTDHNLPGTPAEDDIVVIVLASDGNGQGVLTEAGYTLDVEENVTPGFAVGHKVMGSTPDTVVELTGLANRAVTVLIQVWSGVDPSTPLDVAAVSASGSSGDPNPGSVTPVTDGCLIIACGGLDDDEASVSAAPSGYSNLLSANTSGESAGQGATAMMASKELATATAEDPGAFTTSGDDEWRAATLALKPASAVSGSPWNAYAQQ